MGILTELLLVLPSPVLVTVVVCVCVLCILFLFLLAFVPEITDRIVRIIDVLRRPYYSEGKHAHRRSMRARDHRQKRGDTSNLTR